MENKEVTKGEEKSASINAPVIAPKDHRHDKRNALLVCAAAVLVLFGLGVGMLLHWNREVTLRQPVVGMMGDVRGSHMGINRGRETNPTDGTTVTRLSGVVTQVSSGTFTIAGNGTTKTITTNSDTVYSTTDKTVKVNDTVIITGTDSNNTFTATSVQIANANL